MGYRSWQKPVPGGQEPDVSAAAKRLRALEAEGIDWSRNRNFARFESETDRHALSLRRRLDALAAFVQAHRDTVEVRLLRCEGAHPYEVRVSVARLQVTYAVRLDIEELELAMSDAELGPVLRAARLGSLEPAARR